MADLMKNVLPLLINKLKSKQQDEKNIGTKEMNQNDSRRDGPSSKSAAVSSNFVHYPGLVPKNLERLIQSKTTPEIPPVQLAMEHPTGFESSSGFKHPSGFESSSGFKHPSGFESSSGFKHPSGFESSSGFKHPSGFESSSGFKHPSGFESSSGFKHPSGFESSSGFKHPPGFDHSTGYEHPSGFESSSGFKHPSGNESSSGFKHSSGFESSSGFKHPSGFDHSTGYEHPSGFELCGKLPPEFHSRVDDPLKTAKADIVYEYGHQSSNNVIDHNVPYTLVNPSSSQSAPPPLIPTMTRNDREREANMKQSDEPWFNKPPRKTRFSDASSNQSGKDESSAKNQPESKPHQRKSRFTDKAPTTAPSVVPSSQVAPCYSASSTVMAVPSAQLSFQRSGQVGSVQSHAGTYQDSKQKFNDYVPQDMNPSKTEIMNIPKTDLMHSSGRESGLSEEILQKIAGKIPANLLMDVVKQLPSNMVKDAMEYLCIGDQGSKGGSEVTSITSQISVGGQELQHQNYLSSFKRSDQSSSGNTRGGMPTADVKKSNDVKPSTNRINYRLPSSNLSEKLDLKSTNCSGTSRQIRETERLSSVDVKKPVPLLSLEDLEFKNQMEKKWKGADSVEKPKTEPSVRRDVKENDPSCGKKGAPQIQNEVGYHTEKDKSEKLNNDNKKETSLSLLIRSLKPEVSSDTALPIDVNLERQKLLKLLQKCTEHLSKSILSEKESSKKDDKIDIKHCSKEKNGNLSESSSRQKSDPDRFRATATNEKIEQNSRESSSHRSNDSGKIHTSGANEKTKPKSIEGFNRESYDPERVLGKLPASAGNEKNNQKGRVSGSCEKVLEKCHDSVGNEKNVRSSRPRESSNRESYEQGRTYENINASAVNEKNNRNSRESSSQEMFDRQRNLEKFPASAENEKLHNKTIDKEDSRTQKYDVKRNETGFAKPGDRLSEPKKWLKPSERSGYKSQERNMTMPRKFDDQNASSRKREYEGDSDKRDPYMRKEHSDYFPQANNYETNIKEERQVENERMTDNRIALEPELADTLKNMNVDEMMDLYQKTLTQVISMTAKSDPKTTSESEGILDMLSTKDSSLIMKMQKNMGLSEVGGLAPTLLETFANVSKNLISKTDSSHTQSKYPPKNRYPGSSKFTPREPLLPSVNPSSGRLQSDSVHMDRRSGYPNNGSGSSIRNRSFSPQSKRSKLDQTRGSDCLEEDLLQVINTLVKDKLREPQEHDHTSYKNRAYNPCNARPKQDGLLPNPYIEPIQKSYPDSFKQDHQQRFQPGNVDQPMAANYMLNTNPVRPAEFLARSTGAQNRGFFPGSLMQQDQRPTVDSMRFDDSMARAQVAPNNYRDSNFPVPLMQARPLTGHANSDDPFIDRDVRSVVSLLQSQLGQDLPGQMLARGSFGRPF